MAGVVLALATPTGRKQWRTALVGAVLLVAAGSRIAVLTLVDATAFGAQPWPGCVDSCTMQFGIYQLPATAFLIGFLVMGWWLLATGVAEHLADAATSWQRSSSPRATLTWPTTPRWWRTALGSRSIDDSSP